MKTEVYSWRVSSDLKSGLEREAHRRKLSLAAILDLAARDWLNKSCPDGDDEQLRRAKAASACFGAFASGDTKRSEKARQDIQKRLRRRNGR